MQNEPDVVVACYSSVPREPFLPSPFLLLYAALLELLPDKHSKNRYNRVLHDTRQGWPPTMYGTSFRFDLLLHRLPLVASFDTMLYISTLYWSSSAQMTTIHPIPVSSHLHHSHPAPPAFRSRLAAFLLFFIQLEFRLISCEARWEAARAVFDENCVIPVYKPVDTKLV